MGSWIMKYTIVIAALLIIVSCKKEDVRSESQFQEQLLETDTAISTIYSIKFDCKIDAKSNNESKLLELAETLSELENNYQIKSSKKISLSNSIVLNGLRGNNRKGNFEIVNFSEIVNSIEKIQSCSIKGTKNLGGDTYARAKIEELIFKSEDCAIEAYQIINKIKSSGFIWEEIDKSPNSVFRIENKIYYISLGGWFMMDFYDEIENKIKE